MTIVITGQGELPPQQELEGSSAGRLYGMTVKLNTVPSEHVEFETASSGG